jgi:DNA-binding LacI/PurR family transcriptional regulator
MPCFGDENQHQPNFCSLLADWPALDTLDDIGVGGIIVIAPVVDMAAAVWNASCRVPVEMIAAGASSTPNVFTYSENQELGARLATQHLIDLGHSDIAHVAGSMDWFDGRGPQTRLGGCAS